MPQPHLAKLRHGIEKGIKMSIEHFSDVTEKPHVTSDIDRRPRAGGLNLNAPTAWYVVEVKRFLEQKSGLYINNPKNFDYDIEAYVATQTKKPVTDGRKGKDGGTGKEVRKTVIHSKIFVRVSQDNRIDVLKRCPYLIRYMKDPLRSLTANGFTDFARVPDVEIQRLREILEMVDEPVEYTEFAPHKGEEVEVIGGLLAQSELLKDLKGIISVTNGKKYATVILEGIGGLKFRLPVKDLVQTN